MSEALPPVAELACLLRDSRGFAHKRDIDAVVRRLGLADPAASVPVGDDCAAMTDRALAALT